MLDLNPIDVLKKRRVKFLPIHFSKIKLERSISVDEIEKWISENLKGRFYLGNIPDKGNDNRLQVYTSIAFEDQKELTFFMLACPFYRR